MHGIKVLMAKNYVDNLSEETSKGMREKAEQGIWPSYAPLGYLNADTNGKRHIVLDSETAPLIRRGPYRFCRHPNYLVVVLEIAVLPLAFGAWEIAAVFSGLNAGVLAYRIRIENAMLAERRGAAPISPSPDREGPRKPA